MCYKAAFAIKVWFFLIVSFLCFFPFKLWSQVSGVCSNCHTMHYSQTPWPSEWPTRSPSGPFRALTVGDCIGCHSGSAPIKTIGPSGEQSTIPVVNMTTAPLGTGAGKSLAGGNFYWVTQAGGDPYGHNVVGIAAPDATIGLTPPGWDPTATASNSFGQIAGGAASWTSQLTCAGTYGCHGKHVNDLNGDGVTDNFEAIYGAHHEDDSVIDGSTVGKSYRFLAGILGIEDNDWEYTASATDHNEYKGVNGNSGYTDMSTISYLCAECHGYYHSQAGSHPVWLRHPTDFALPNSGEYAAVYGTSYDPVVPLGEDDLSLGVQSTVNSSGNIVMCISCHRAHGSEFFKAMRWDYKGSVYGDKCSVCHTEKN